jgi:predicted  nucleic acid-binding Zn-ribbon protein
VDQTVLLTKLQDLDLEIMRGHKRLDELPEKAAILEMRKKIRDFETVRARTVQVFESVDRAVKKAEDESAALTGKIDAEQAKMMSGEVTNPKEVANLSRELASLQRQKDKLDNDTLDLMEKREKASQQRDKVDAAIAEAHRREEGLVRDYQSRGGEVSAEVGRLEAERKLVAAALDAALLDQYEKLREQKHGIGLGVLHDQTCSACRMELPSDKVNVLKAGPPVAVCPACHRLLVVTPPPKDAE